MRQMQEVQASIGCNNSSSLYISNDTVIINWHISRDLLLPRAIKFVVMLVV